MRVKISTPCLIAVFLVVFGASSLPAVVTVTPENMSSYGWSIETNQTATADFANYGYAVAQRPVGNGPGPFVADDGAYTNLGQGAYYVTLGNEGWGGTTPPSAWLGLDMHNGQSLAGVALSRIKKLNYYALNSHWPTSTQGGAGDWTSWTWWAYSRQPIQVQITAQSPDGTDRKQFWCLPFEPAGWVPDGSKGSWLRGDNCGQNTNKWICYDCMVSANTVPAQGALQSYWYCPQPEMAFQTWADLIAGKPDPEGTLTFGDYTLVPTSSDPWPTGYKSMGWDSTTSPQGTPLCTGTGKCINLEVGARKGSTAVYFNSSPISWVTDFAWFRGYADRFTLGVDLNGDGDDMDTGERVTYNFEPSAGTPAPKPVCMTVKSSYDAVFNTLNTNQPGRVMVKLVGEVAARGNPRFWMDDVYGFGAIPTGVPQIVCYTFEGDPMKGTSHLWPNPAYIGDYFSITGILERPVIEHNDNMWPMWTHYQGCEFLY
jgi:hypothetical protein